ncbi:MAG: hypothetical protein HYZ42_07050 [Bacteroidetes bacterium]|nr:hypothetical protein [Bacteroidota bacterium]
MYNPEAGQFRTQYEMGQAHITYSYDIDIFAFDPDENLKRFAQKRAFIKTIMKFSDIYDIGKSKFVIDISDDRYLRIFDGLNFYYPDDQKLIIDQMPKVFSDLVEYLK